jgi:hypothetical protein
LPCDVDFDDAIDATPSRDLPYSVRNGFRFVIDDLSQRPLLWRASAFLLELTVAMICAAPSSFAN